MLAVNRARLLSSVQRITAKCFYDDAGGGAVCDVFGNVSSGHSRGVWIGRSRAGDIYHPDVRANASTESRAISTLNYSI